jgi:PilZ domain
MSLWRAVRALFLSLRSARRRSHPRVRAGLGVDWRAFGSQVHHVSELADLSAGGAFVRTSEPRPVGSPIVVDLATGGGHALLDVHARVAWLDRTGMGLRFTRAIALPG